MPTNNPTLDAFLTQNLSVNFSTIDLFSRQQLDSLNWGSLSRNELLHPLLSYQRMLRVTENNSALAGNLMSLGFHSAQQIDMLGQTAFQTQVQAEFPSITVGQITTLYNKAHDIGARAVILAATAHNTTAPYSRQLRVNSVSPKMIQEFQSITGYDEIFGAIRKCNCSECTSIFGPSAYFVDLMRLIDKHITKGNTIPTGYSLLERRPDLKAIPLTCENTLTEVPYLELVNQVLENTIITQNNNAHRIVTNVYQDLANKTYPFEAPYHRPLDQARSFLGHTGTTLAEVIAGVNLSGEYSQAWVIETLGLSHELYELITYARTVPLFNDYGIKDFNEATMEQLSKPAIFMAQTGLTAEELKELFYLNLSTEEFNRRTSFSYFYINYQQGNESSPEIIRQSTSPENADEYITNLNVTRLRYINRFVRLAKQLNWSFEELNWVLTVLDVFDLNEECLTNLAKIKSITQKLGISVFTCTAFIADIKITGWGNGKQSQSQFDQIFNTPIRVQSRPKSIGVYRPITPDGSSVNHPLFTSPVVNGAVGSSILKCLGASNNDLAAIVQFFKGQVVETLELHVPNLSFCYRHLTFAKSLGLSVNDYLQLVVALGKRSQTVFTIDDLLEILKASAWMEEWGFNAYELSYIISGPNTYVNPGLNTNESNNALMSLATQLKPALVVEKDFSAYTLGSSTIQNLFSALTAAGSVETGTIVLDDDKLKLIPLKDVPNLLLKNGYPERSKLVAQLLEKTVSDEFAELILSHLQQGNYVDTIGIVNHPIADYTWQTVTLSTSLVQNNIKYDLSLNINLSSDQVAQIKGQINNSYTEQQTKIVASFATTFAVDVALMNELVAGTKRLCLVQNSVSFFAENYFGPSTQKQHFFNELSKWIFIAQKFQFGRNAMNYIFDTRNLLSFENNANGWETVNWNALQNIARTKSVLSDSVNDPEQIAALLLQCIASLDLSADVLNALNWSLNEFGQMKKQLYGESNFRAYAPQIFKIKTGINICRKTHLGVAELIGLADLPTLQATDGNWRIMESTVHTLINALSSHTSKERWPELYKKLNGQVLEHQRKALVAEALYLLGGEYNDERKLSEFLLLDVTMNSTTEISLVKQGLNTAQLYLQRCRLHLEKGVVVNAHDFHESWWEWIMNYRVWEANRKVFMYPENYLDPSLRHNKTNLFEDLESALSQGQVDNVLVEGAFKKYMDGFEKIATLHYVEAYNCVTTDAGQDFDTLFLFGRTKTKPNEYYYITRKKPVDGASTAEVWSEWSKINAPINADYITPVYAFNKLFVFWMEVKSNQERDQTSSDRDKKATVWKADIKFTYHNFSGDWTQPQDVVKDKVMNVETEQKFTVPHEHMFDPRCEYWYKVGAHVFNINPENNSEEKIILHFGPLVKDNNVLFTNSTIIDNNTLTGSISRYTGPLWDFLLPMHKLHHNLFAIQGKNENLPENQKLRGYLLFHQALVIGADLIPSNLLNNEEALFFENDTTQHSIQFNSDDLETGFAITDNTLYTNYEQGMIVARNQSPIGESIAVITPESYLNAKNNQLIAVKNNAGNCILNIDSESFLIEASAFSRIDQSLSSERISIGLGISAANFLAPAGNNAEIAGALLTVTRQWAFVDANGLGSSRVMSKSDFVSSIRHQYEIAIVNSIFHSNSNSGFLLAVLKLGQNNYQWNSVYDIIINAIQNLAAHPALITTLKYTNSKPNFDIDHVSFAANRISTNAIDLLSKKLFAYDLDQVLALDAQQAPQHPQKNFARFNPNQPHIIAPAQAIGDQVSFEGPYGNYYWELFFHAPLLVSKTLKTNQQFIDAEKWLQYIFNPTLGKNKTDYWRYLPFQNRIAETLASQLQNDNAIAVYNDDPFDPHAIAKVRPGAYEKSVVMQYIDNLLEWGDNMFGKYTWESVTTASMLYMYAYDLLGNRPEQDVEFQKTTAITFNDILNTSKRSGEEIPQFFTELENAIASRVENLSAFTAPPSGDGGGSGGGPIFATSKVLGRVMPFSNLEAYFHVPENEQFVAYWDRVEDRLYKIRNGLNLQGVRQTLALFEPPIDPLQLIQAAANGGNFLDVATQAQTNVPIYRFALVLEKARSFTQTVIQLGASLLAALEKNDAEKLSVLHSSQEVTIQNMLLQIKQQQITEQEQSLDGLMINLESAQNRFDHYDQLVYMNDYEIASMGLMATASKLQKISNGVRSLTVAGYLAPNIFGFADGGMKFGDAINVGAQVLGEEAAIMNQIASILNTKASYERRKEEWKLQKEIAQFEVNQINSQIEATKTRIDIARQELAIQNTTIRNAREIDTFLKSKFTNTDLYQWMLGRLSTLYFESYKLASNTALMAQQAYNFELDTNENFITFDSWDSLHKGLLAGEGLMFSIEQMEKAHLVNNTRRYEIEKTISLRQQFPEEFLKFKMGGNSGEKGTIHFQLKQSLFDFDFPNHYARKIKAISISIPAVVGPYQNINATLTQNSNSIALKPDLNAVKYMLDSTEARPANDSIRENWIPSQQIALSKGIDDMGMFTLNFNDERLLPFEGTGAVSSWTLKMPPERNRFDFESISDVIVKVYYTALDGGEKFSADVVKTNKGKNTGVINAKVMNLKQAFPNAWNQMVTSTATKPSMAFKITDDQALPSLDVSVKGILVQFKTVDGTTPISGNNLITLQMGDTTNPSIGSWKLNVNDNFGALPNSSITTNAALPSRISPLWNLVLESVPSQFLNNGKIDETKLQDIVVVVLYDTTFKVTQTMHLKSSTFSEPFVSTIMNAPQTVTFTYDASACKYTIGWNNIVGNAGYLIRIVDQETKSIVAASTISATDATSIQIQQNLNTTMPGSYVAQVCTLGGAGKTTSSYTSSSALGWTSQKLFRQPILTKWSADRLPTIASDLQFIQIDNAYQGLKWLDYSFHFFRYATPTNAIKIIAYSLDGSLKKEIVKPGIKNVISIALNLTSKTIVLTGTAIDNTAATITVSWDELNIDKMHHWSFEESSGTTLLDSLGTVNGTLVGAGATREMPGRTGNNALRLSGVYGSYASFGSAIGQFGTRDFTIAFWMKTTDKSLPNNDIIGNRTAGSHGNFICIRMIGTHPTGVAGTIGAEIDEDGMGKNYTAVGSNASAVRVTDGAWHHVAVTRKGNVLSLYLDGAFVSSGTSTATTNIANANDFRIGQSYAIGSRFTPNAAYDDLFICEKALTVDELIKYTM